MIFYSLKYLFKILTDRRVENRIFIEYENRKMKQTNCLVYGLIEWNFVIRTEFK